MSTVELNKPAPDFSLPDINEKQFALSDLRGKKNAVLVFNRGFT